MGIADTADTNFQELAEDERLAVSSHTARQVNALIISEHDLLPVMQQGQKNWIARRVPHRWNDPRLATFAPGNEQARTNELSLRAKRGNPKPEPRTL